MTPSPNEETVLRQIATAFRDSRSSSLRLGVGDDTALFAPRQGYETILTCDWFLEGTHFLKDKHPADAIGWKCLARAASDIAAMGGTPRCFLLSLALSGSQTGRWLRGFLRGLFRASQALRCELAGGDTTRQDNILINVTVIGEVRAGRAILRSGARPGDILFVSGKLGEAALGLRQVLRRSGMARATSPALRKHLYPEPRLALGQSLSENQLATAMMDLSDGLSTDLPRLCTASGVGARLDAISLPTPLLKDPREARLIALNGGDDYELLFTVNRRNEHRIPRSFHGLGLTRIGEITRHKKILLVENEKSRALPSSGWDPFRKP